MVIRSRVVFALIAVVCLISAELAGQGAGADTWFSSFAVVKPGKSKEATALYISRMGVVDAALRSFFPTKYTLKAGGFSAESSGAMSFQRTEAKRLGSFGGLELYAVDGQSRNPALPKADQVISVSFAVADLAAAEGAIQPGLKAIELAARKAGKPQGSAWIISIAREGKTKLLAKVGLDF